MDNKTFIARWVTNGTTVTGAKHGNLRCTISRLYSYTTPIALRLPNGNILCSDYVYSPTTARHLAALRTSADRTYSLKYYYIQSEGRYAVPGSAVSLADLVALNLPWIEEKRKEAIGLHERARTDANRTRYFLRAKRLEELAANLETIILGESRAAV